MTCVWRWSVVWDKGWPSGGGIGKAFIWLGLVRRIGRWDGRGGEGDRWDRYGDGLNRGENNVANLILGTEHNAPLAYAQGL